MESVLTFFNNYFSFFGISGTRIALAVVVLVLSLLFKRLFSLIVLHRLRNWTKKTKTELDDSLLEVLNPPLQTNKIYIMFNKVPDNKKLISDFNKGLEIIKKDGTMTKILKEFGVIKVLKKH